MLKGDDILLRDRPPLSILISMTWVLVLILIHVLILDIRVAPSASLFTTHPAAQLT